MGTTPSINRNDLTCDVGRIKQQKSHRTSDIRRRSDPAEQGVSDDGIPFGRSQLAIVGPLDRPRRNPIHPYPRRQFQRQRARQAEQ